MSSSPTAALDSESIQLRGWLIALGRAGIPENHPQVSAQVAQVKERLKRIDDAKKQYKRQGKRARKVVGQISQVLDVHDKEAAGHFRRLLKNQSDPKALAGMGNALAQAAVQDPKLKAVAGTLLPLITQIFVDNDDDDTED